MAGVDEKQASRGKEERYPRNRDRERERER